MRITVLDAFAADHGQLTWNALSELGSVVVHPRTPRERILERVQGSEAIITNKVELDGRLIAQLPKVRYIGIAATGTNAVDLDACCARHVAVTNVPGYSTRSVAQLVIGLMLYFCHGVAKHDAAVKQGAWARSPDFSFTLFPLTELADKTLCLLGLGAIGRTVSSLAESFGMRVVAAAVPGSTRAGRVPLGEALAESDFVSLHCPLTPETQRLVSTEFLASMKPGAILINTGRGGLVDEAALLEALRNGKLGGAALDVLEEEPPASDHPLLKPDAPWADRLVVTPHIAWATVEARRRLIAEVAENLRAFCRGERRNRVDVPSEP